MAVIYSVVVVLLLLLLLIYLKALLTRKRCSFITEIQTYKERFHL